MLAILGSIVNMIGKTYMTMSIFTFDNEEDIHATW